MGKHCLEKNLVKKIWKNVNLSIAHRNINSRNQINGAGMEKSDNVLGEDNALSVQFLLFCFNPNHFILCPGGKAK